MAGCYHDKQGFKSDLNIEVAREGDILESGQDLKNFKCTKNPEHRGFIPFKNLTFENLPNEHRNREMFDKIKKMGSIVVRLMVDQIVNGEQKTKLGSGCVIKIDNEYLIKTNNHVVKTEDEVNNCHIEFHYDDDSRSSVLTSRGVKLANTCPYRDVTLFKFHPVPDFLHQLDWTYDKQPTIVILYKNNKIKTELARIHLLRFVSQLDINSSLIDLMYILLHDGSVSWLKSCYFKFEGISSNIQQFTSIQIHINEDDGNSKVIPGYVVDFGDEFVVKISESIFQEEVKKCKLVLNGEVIGRGTSLYFQRVKASDINRRIDVEEQTEDNYWIYDCHPIPRFIEDMQHKIRSHNLCCIGHPHGVIKMVTFGRLLGTSHKRFDNQGQPIIQPYKDCKCKEVTCVKYTCKTCPGSSGSPVFQLNEWIEWGSSFIHFMSDRVNQSLPNGELEENINIAWSPS